jgi:hypothetical protein
VGPVRRRRARHGRRRQALHSLCLTLARHADVARVSWQIVEAYHARDRMGRISAVFSFVAHLAEDPAAEADDLRDGIDLLMRVAGPQRARVVLLTAMLLATGERARIEYTREMVFVSVEVAPEDIARLPPHAHLVCESDRTFLPLDPAHPRQPIGFLPLAVRAALARRRRVGELASAS